MHHKHVYPGALGIRDSGLHHVGGPRVVCTTRLRVGDNIGRINNDGFYVWAAKDREKDFIERPQKRGLLKGR